MRRNKDTLKQILRDAKTSHQSEVEALKAKLEQAREAIKVMTDMIPDNYFDIYDLASIELDERQVRQLKAVLK